MSKFIAIGDITTDAFIKLKNAKVDCVLDSEKCTISIPWGSKIPYDSVVEVPGVGNSPNASVTASRFGLDSSIVTFVGKDRFGEVCIDSLKEKGVDTSLISIQDGKKTNYHYVISFDAERTILVRHEEFNYSLPNIPNDAEWFYLSSLGESGFDFHFEIIDFIKNNNKKLAFQPGTFQMKLGYEKLKEVYKLSDLFFCNKEEAKLILNTEETDMKKLLEMMHGLGPKICVITDGREGAYAYDGKDSFYMPIYPDPKPPVERTGAGDSFSSAFTCSIASGMSLDEALMRAPINSMSVVQYIGAQEGILTRDEIEKLLKNAPDDYKIEKL